MAQFVIRVRLDQVQMRVQFTSFKSGQKGQPQNHVFVRLVHSKVAKLQARLPRCCLWYLIDPWAGRSPGTHRGFSDMRKRYLMIRAYPRSSGPHSCPGYVKENAVREVKEVGSGKIATLVLGKQRGAGTNVLYTSLFFFFFFCARRLKIRSIALSLRPQTVRWKIRGIDTCLMLRRHP